MFVLKKICVESVYHLSVPICFRTFVGLFYCSICPFVAVVIAILVSEEESLKIQTSVTLVYKFNDFFLFLLLVSWFLRS